MTFSVSFHSIILGLIKKIKSKLPSFGQFSNLQPLLFVFVIKAVIKKKPYWHCKSDRFLGCMEEVNVTWRWDLYDL